MNMRQAASSSITEALKQNGSYQIYFVVTLSAGRLRPEDMTTVLLVLVSAPDIKSFNIIVNKLSLQEYECLENDSNKKLQLLAPLEIIGGKRKYKVLLLLHNHMLEDAEDMISNYPELDTFVEKSPWVDIDPLNVNDIPGDDDSFNKQMDSITNKLGFAHTQLPTTVRL